MLKQSRGWLRHVLHKTTCGLELLKPRCWTLLILSFEDGDDAKGSGTALNLTQT